MSPHNVYSFGHSLGICYLYNSIIIHTQIQNVYCGSLSRLNACSRLDSGTQGRQVQMSAFPAWNIIAVAMPSLRPLCNRLAS